MFKRSGFVFKVIGFKNSKGDFMAFVNGLNVNVDCRKIEVEDTCDFMRQIYEGGDSVLQLSPSDSRIDIDIDRMGQRYKAVVKLASSVLGIREVSAIASSPYVAFESAIMKLKKLVSNWSMVREFNESEDFVSRG